MNYNTEKRLEKELFEMVYQWGKVGVVTNHKCFAFRSAMQENIKQALAEERERVSGVVAEYIYNHMPYDGVGTKPSWVVGGNSLKQEDARALTIKLLSLDKLTEKE